MNPKKVPLCLGCENALDATRLFCHTCDGGVNFTLCKGQPNSDCFRVFMETVSKGIIRSALYQIKPMKWTKL
jgi:predicted amidophosphoribosyltransferase